MANVSILIKLLSSAIRDYNLSESLSNYSEWLHDYLRRELSEKSEEAIQLISSEILDTLDIMDSKQYEMGEAMAKGISPEDWLTKDIMNEPGDNGDKARKAAEFFSGAVCAEKTFNDSEVVDTSAVEIEEDNAEEFNNSNWNDYKLKDTLKGIAIDVGNIGMKSIASDFFRKATEECFENDVNDDEFMKDSLLEGPLKGIKVAVSSGLVVAEESGILPKTAVKVLTATAHRTVESLSAVVDVVKGKLTVVDAIIKIKNTAVSTFAGMWHQHKESIKEEIVGAVSSVFGLQGAIIAGAVNGLVTPKKNESKVVTVLKEIGNSAVNFLKKEVKIPFLNKIKNKISFFA